MIALTRYPSASWASHSARHSCTVGPGFTTRRQARQTDRPNRVHISYGLVVRFRLLPTPPHDDAVTFSYRPESAYLKRTYTSRIKQTCRRTIPASPTPESSPASDPSRCLHTIPTACSLSEFMAQIPYRTLLPLHPNALIQTGMRISQSV